jgi:hypothetical protein
MNAEVGYYTTRRPLCDTVLVFRLYISNNSMHQFRCNEVSKVSCYGIPIRLYGVMSHNDTLIWSIEEEVRLLLIRPECTRIGTQKFLMPGSNIDSRCRGKGFYTKEWQKCQRCYQHRTGRNSAHDSLCEYCYLSFCVGNRISWILEAGFLHLVWFCNVRKKGACRNSNFPLAASF